MPMSTSLSTPFHPVRGWRIIDPDGKLWAESGNEDEIRARMRPGDTLQRLWRREEYEWCDV